MGLQEKFGVVPVIRIDAGDVGAPRSGEAGGEGRHMALVLVMKYGNQPRIVKASYHVARVIARTIVDDNHFKRIVSLLCEGTSDTIPEETAVVVTKNDKADARWVGACSHLPTGLLELSIQSPCRGRYATTRCH